MALMDAADLVITAVGLIDAADVIDVADAIDVAEVFGSNNNK